MKTYNDSEAFTIFSEAFDDLDRPNRIFVRITELRKRLWDKYRINRNQFQEMLQKLYEIPEYGDKISLAGGPIYRKDDWVLCNGKKWLFIEIRTPEHESYMRGHR